jgi:hypothetical protein
MLNEWNKFILKPVIKYILLGGSILTLGNSVSIVTRLGVGLPCFDSRQGLGLNFLATTSRPGLGPAETPFQWIKKILSSEVQQPGLEADHSPPSSAEIKTAWSYISTPQYVFMAW